MLIRQLNGVWWETRIKSSWNLRFSTHRIGIGKYDCIRLRSFRMSNLLLNICGPWMFNKNLILLKKWGDARSPSKHEEQVWVATEVAREFGESVRTSEDRGSGSVKALEVGEGHGATTSPPDLTQVTWVWRKCKDFWKLRKWVCQSSRGWGRTWSYNKSIWPYGVVGRTRH